MLAGGRARPERSSEAAAAAYARRSRCKEGTMAEVDEFVAATIPRQIEAEIALHEGDVEPRLSMWSHDDPVTLFGAYGVAKQGWDELSATFRWLAGRFSNLSDYD